ncbi:hypothetical protein [Enhygromyxa salina]|uniref:Lipoprotein n=1 Tax=Enhygromyxa salina TaxID=215803 RepID=A0A2S9YXC5_9BACT|nr:hypothetical protein [Enhygromyxa salina]PRQ09741.1 hypothetical protein ENSA7_04960 [Enhygromyxa salina]
MRARLALLATSLVFVANAGCGYPVFFSLDDELAADPVVLGPDLLARSYEISVCVTGGEFDDPSLSLTLHFDLDSNIAGELGVHAGGLTRDLAEYPELDLDPDNCEPMEVTFLVTDPDIASEQAIPWRATASVWSYDKKFKQSGEIELEIVDLDG